MQDSVEDTICAIATPIGEGGIGIIRISGEQALAVASKVFSPRNCKPLEKLDTHKMYVGDIFSHENGQFVDELDFATTPIDEALVVVMKRPRSYTGEDVVEIHTHGGACVLQATCQALIHHGARLSEPGEFTKRAFLNGRLDLAQAEAVLDIIQAETSRSLRAAQSLLRGSLSKEVELLRENMIGILAHLEAGMDFVEEDISFVTVPELQKVLKETHEKLWQLIETFEEGRLLREGIQAVIMGRVNVGKSSLLNSLLKMDRAIVSDVPGTTRDVIQEAINIHGIPLHVIDTAGLRTTDNAIEGEGIRRTEEAIAQADVLLIVIDGSVKLSEEDPSFFKEFCSKRCIIVVNKVDLPQQIQKKHLEEIFSKIQSRDNRTLKRNRNNTPPIIDLSAKTGEGLDKLKLEIRNLFYVGGCESGHSVLVTRTRHKVALENARVSVQEALQSVTSQQAGECIALDIRTALDALGEIIGAVSTDDILDRIFADFCIGK